MSICPSFRSRYNSVNHHPKWYVFLLHHIVNIKSHSEHTNFVPLMKLSNLIGKHLHML